MNPFDRSNSLHARGDAGSSMRRLRLATAVAAAGVAAGCATYSPGGFAVGTPREQVLAAMGPPTGTLQAPGRLEFARGPYGKHTYMVDFDADGRLVGWEQVLTEANFYRVLPGQTDTDVLKRLGHPSETFTIGRQHIEVWNYRFEGPFCQWFQVSIGTSPDTRGQVTDVGFGPDPACTPRY